MIKLILHGCNGKMGQAVSSAAAADGNIKIVAGVDPYPNSAENSFPVYETLSQVKEEADVVLDFLFQALCLPCWTMQIKLPYPW